MIDKAEYLEAKKIVKEYEDQMNLQPIIASEFLTKRKISFTNSLRSMFRKNPNSFKVIRFYECEKIMRYGYDLAVRRLKKNSL